MSGIPKGGPLDQARKLFRDFQGREAQIGRDEIVRIGGMLGNPIALEVGEVIGLGYRALGDGVEYWHAFNKHNRPLLYVNSDGRGIYMLKGAWRFTSRGFVG